MRLTSLIAVATSRQHRLNEQPVVVRCQFLCLLFCCASLLRRLSFPDADVSLVTYFFFSLRSDHFGCDMEGGRLLLLLLICSLVSGNSIRVGERVAGTCTSYFLINFMFPFAQEFFMMIRIECGKMVSPGRWNSPLILYRFTLYL
jgi:hypothetical protein